MTTVDQARQQSFQQTLKSAHHTMMFSEILRLAIDSFRANKLRFALTALGMVIGTASVILVVTIGLTGKQFILDQIQKIGTNEVEVEYAGGGATGADRLLYNDYLTREDEKAVLTQVPSVLYSSPILETHDRISFGGGVVKDTLIMASARSTATCAISSSLAGRFFDDQDEDAHIKCAVVTVPFAKQMFGSPDAAIGRDFSIQGIPFTIIGTFKEGGETFGQSEITDNTILIPYSVARYFTGTNTVKTLYFSVRTLNEVPDATREITRVISSRHKPSSVYKAQNLTEVLTMAATIANALTAILVLVAAVTLAVGGVGIMNIMLATVRARIREIGIRKALGATYREIKLQFLAEAVIISLTGGLVGVIVGLIVPFPSGYLRTTRCRSPGSRSSSPWPRPSSSASYSVPFPPRAPHSSTPSRPSSMSSSGPNDEPPQGPNLFLLYALIAFGTLLAMACAAAIVWPFYHRR